MIVPTFPGYTAMSSTDTRAHAYAGTLQRTTALSAAKVADILVEAAQLTHSFRAAWLYRTPTPLQLPFSCSPPASLASFAADRNVFVVISGRRPPTHRLHCR